EEDRDYYLERRYPAFGNLVPRDVASRAAKVACDDGRGVGPEVDGVRRGVYLDFADAIKRVGRKRIEERYGNLFDMYHHITDEDPYEVPMRIYPAVHYTMGGLWVDYNLMSNLEGLFVIGEANFSDHGANRLGASALMQGLADGYFVVPYTVGNYLARHEPIAGTLDKDHDAAKAAKKAVKQRLKNLLEVNGTKTVDAFHRELGLIMWDKCGMARDEEGLTEAIDAIRKLREEFWENVRVPGKADAVNPELEKAARVADFLELGELMTRDALNRNESCGGHFRVESATEEGEAKRDDNNFAYVAAWEFNGTGEEPTLHKEELEFEYVKLTQRSYK
ncbi:MAG: FAD-binding protein, partial [Myxococcota bacterium]